MSGFKKPGIDVAGGRLEPAMLRGGDGSRAPGVRFTKTFKAKGGEVKKSTGAKKSAAKPGLYANINAKRKRIAAGSGEKMRTPGSKGAPTAKAFRESAKTAKKRK